MIKNSVSRITKRRQGALTRRLVNRIEIVSGKGIYAALDDKALGIKLGRVSTDIENLGKKGIR